MTLLKRSTISAAAVVGVLATSASPAAAIVGGQDATHTYPGVAAVSVLFPGVGTAKCGGTLITPRFLLTAAHCVSDDAVAPTPVAVPAGNISLRVGSNDRTAGGQTATGRRVLLHPDWMWGYPTGKPISDVALVELTDPVPTPVTPLGVRQADLGHRLRLLGWGLTAYPPPAGTTIPTMLQQRDTTRLAATACQGGFISTAEVCVSAGACYGDSGAPALRPLSGRQTSRRPGWASVGIASRETDQDNPCTGPTVYTDLTQFRDWIATTIATSRTPRCTCPPLRTLDTTARTRIGLLKPTIQP